MSENLNRVQLIGEIEKLPEVSYMQNGTEVIDFTVRTEEKYVRKDDGNEQRIPSYHRVVSYGKRFSDMLKHEVKKGEEVFVEGKLKTRKYKDKSGEERYITEVVVGMYDGLICLHGGKTTNEVVYDIPYE